MSGHLDGPPPGPPDPPYIPGDLGAPSAEEFARRRASPTPEEWNPYAPSADWKPGQDTFTSQAAGIWAEGFAAGRAAATPDPPHTPDCSANMLANFADCSCAATPDPQDEEACLRWTCESCGWNVVVPMPGYAGDGHYHYGPPQNTRCGPLVARREGFIRALPGADLLAAPSHGGDEAAGTPTTVLNTEPSSAAASPDERLREAATAIEGLLRNIATPDRPVVASESDRATDVAFARRVLARLAAADCKVRETSMEHERLEQQTLRLRGKLSAIAQTIGLELGGGEDGYLVPAVERLVEGVAERDQAITAALSAMSASQYVDGGITEREAWQRAGELLEPYRIKQQGTA